MKHLTEDEIKAAARKVFEQLIPAALKFREHFAEASDAARIAASLMLETMTERLSYEASPEAQAIAAEVANILEAEHMKRFGPERYKEVVAEADAAFERVQAEAEIGKPVADC